MSAMHFFLKPYTNRTINCVASYAIEIQWSSSAMTKWRALSSLTKNKQNEKLE